MSVINPGIQKLLLYFTEIVNHNPQIDLRFRTVPFPYRHLFILSNTLTYHNNFFFVTKSYKFLKQLNKTPYIYGIFKTVEIIGYYLLSLVKQEYTLFFFSEQHTPVRSASKIIHPK